MTETKTATESVEALAREDVRWEYIGHDTSSGPDETVQEEWVRAACADSLREEVDRLRYELEASEALVANLREKLDEAGRDTKLIDTIASEYWDLRCVDYPTGMGDADVGWRVVSHHQGKNPERIEGESFVDDPRAALRAALRAQAQEGQDDG